MAMREARCAMGPIPATPDAPRSALPGAKGHVSVPFAEDARRVRRARLRWPDASAPPARLRMDGAAAQLLLVTPHVIVSEHVLVMWNKVKNKDDWSSTSLHRPMRRRAV